MGDRQFSEIDTTITLSNRSRVRSLPIEGFLEARSLQRGEFEASGNLRHAFSKEVILLSFIALVESESLR
ncbi:hypothetical protein CKA32_002170 [Geitlerinema sp. FC II]|nr:hypothetical protein CKA32_002170 [Geitlerinema sp. FC II]